MHTRVHLESTGGDGEGGRRGGVCRACPAKRELEDPTDFRDPRGSRCLLAARFIRRLPSKANSFMDVVHTSIAAAAWDNAAVTRMDRPTSQRSRTQQKFEGLLRRGIPPSHGEQRAGV